MINKEIMRYLAASVLQQASFRSHIIDFVEADRRALGPELDIDLKRLTKLSYLVISRTKKYNRFYFGIALSAMLVAWLTPFYFGIAIVVVGGFIVHAHKNYSLQQELLPFLKTSKQDLQGLEKFLEKKHSYPDYPRTESDQEQNLVVYRGFTPFVGSGYQLGGWSFPITIDRPKEELGQICEIQSFTMVELYDAVLDAMKKCGFANLSARDLLFVSGSRIRDQKWVLPSIYESPKDYVDQDILHQYREKRDSLARYYKWIMISDREAELIISYYLRFSISGSQLFAELNTFLLTPIAEQYKEIDSLLEPTKGRMILSVLGSAVVGPIATIIGFVSVIGELLAAVDNFVLFGWRKRIKEKEADRNIHYDYGANTTLREYVSGGTYSHYFQRLDKEMYTKIFSKQILTAISDFLDDHNIDTSDIKERQTTILNNGVMVQGGDVKAEALSVGEGAQATVSK